MRFTPLFVMLFLALAAYGQERVAIINTVDDRDSIGFSDLSHLTNRLRETAVKVLPKSRYGVMTTESIVAFLGSEERAMKICKENCLTELGRKVSADYVAQARVGRFGNQLSINFQLYNTKTGNLIDSFTGNSYDIFGLLDIIEKKAPALFKQMPGVSQETYSVVGGIGGVQVKGTDYEFKGEKRYLANISSDPEGASLSFNGVPNARCTKTPCSVELGEGSVRIITALEQYDIADTTVSIKQNNQSIRIRMKANFGVLEIKPAYSDGIGKDEEWSLTINSKTAFSLENRLSPNKYNVELSHRCYEAISFDVGINRDKREVFDMANHVRLKKGGLVLNAEKNGEPVSEPVFVNGNWVGETPFSDAVPLCAKVEVGGGREMVNVKLKHNEKIEHTHIFYVSPSYKHREPVYVEDTTLDYMKNSPLFSEQVYVENLKQKNKSSYTIQSMINSPIRPWLGAYYQRIWDMHHIGLNIDMLYFTLGMKTDKIMETDEIESIFGLIHRWVIIPDNFIKMSFGLFGGIGGRTVQFEGEDHSNWRHELGVEFVLGYLSLYISERNFHRIGIGMGVISWGEQNQIGAMWRSMAK